MKVVIDTNCLLASVSKKSSSFWLYEAFRDKKFVWVLSTDILNEYYEVLSDFFSPETADIVITRLIASDNVELTQPYFYYNLIDADPDDNKFANLALSANVHFLVSNDKHFNILKNNEFPPLKVVSLTEFKEIIFPSN